MAKKITKKDLKKALIKLINKSNIEEIICEPRYLEGYEDKKVWIGSIITIRTLNKGVKRGNARR